MIVAHLSDLHLGYRAYDREVAGRNVRELDVEGAFDRALDRLMDLKPGLVVVSGDVFDRPDPPSSAVVALAKGLERLRSAAMEAPIVMIAGSSDTPLRAGGQGALAAFDTIPGVEAAQRAVRTVRIAGGEVSVTLVPHRALLETSSLDLRPDPAARWNVLVMRARVAEPSHALRLEPRGSDPDLKVLHVDPAGWDYVALGYRHTQSVVAPRVAYAGALERIGPDPWREAATEKGFLTVDLASGTTTFSVIPGRPVVELARIRFRPDDPEHTARRVREVVRETPGGIEGKIVRMRIEGLPGGSPPRVDEALMDDLRRQALHVSVRMDWPAADGAGADLDEHLTREGRLGESDVDRLQELRRLLRIQRPEPVP